MECASRRATRGARVQHGRPGLSASAAVLVSAPQPNRAHRRDSCPFAVRQVRAEPRARSAEPPPGGCDPRAKLNVHFLCLRASVALAPVASVTRSLLLASGTLSPFDLLATELGLHRCASAPEPAPAPLATVTPLVVAEVSCAHLDGLKQRLLPVYMTQRAGVPLSATCVTRPPHGACAR